ncbi:uncharacterized protein LOC117204065 isoform X2 [Bombus bifarius]|uniref:tRNA (uracil(54)-C(5))-methyltransferase n=1 Tax=Bombus bifarius TaxID=103933 RepID=A0A6P8LFS3_9HYME|nr:uncharacterized protein LOC117204065 isoform X2 [Bombus bifarius]XP_033296979.1 uncharacterized protein LOC117204065 isoform X2 [Bombus bifarius]
MESSGAVTIEGENYQVVDECIEEEDTSNGVQHKYVQNIDTEKQSNTSDKNIQQSDDTNERKENINIENRTNIDVGKNKNTIVEEKSDSYMEKDENTIVEEKSNSCMEKDEDTIVEEKSESYMEKDENIIVEEKNESYMEKNENTIVEEKSDSYMEKNENTTIEKEECTKIKENENITIRKEKDTNIDMNDDISMEKDEEVPIVDSTNSALSDNLNPNDNDGNNKSNMENKCSQQSNVESIDFTADITLDQLDQQRSMTDEDILHNLDEIENIELDPKDFQIQEENEPMEKGTKDHSSHTKSKFVKESEEDESINVDKTTSNTINKEIKQEKSEKSEKNDWYEKKLIEKETIIKERLSKVARVLGISYPFYEKWLEHEEKINGSPLCKLKPSRRCCLDKPYTNRWKFICNKKDIHESITEVDNPDISFSKNRKIVWKLEPSGAWGVNINNESQFPSFVLRAVKIFEDFLQTTEQSLISHNSSDVNFSDDVSIDVVSKKDTNNEERQDWLWLVVRCNSMDELMLFATGQNISRSTMDRLKQVYESGPGKDCNVKSLYCKSTNKYDDTAVTDTTFLVGSEALDEIVGGLKVQLAPKTNFWSNTAGAENVATAVIDLLAPTPKTTVLEIGCGIGLIGLMMASKCQQVIGVDSPSEVEEAEMTCELNNIKNASFIMGSPIEVTTKIIAAVKNRKTCAIINANTNVGRAIEVMTALRKIPSLKRIVMITTLTKQSVRAILELARPGDHSHGSPFIPIVACVVDTLPNGPHFEAVILMQRRMINKFTQIWSQKTAGEDIKSSEIKIVHEKINQQNTNQIGKKISSKPTELQTKMNFNKFLVKNHARKSKISIKKAFYIKHAENSSIKNRFKRKRSHSPDKGETPKKLMKKFSKSCVIAWHPDQASKKKKEWDTGNSQLCTNIFHEKKMQERPKEQTDLRERLSHNRLDTDIAQTLKEHQALLEIAKEKLSGPAPTVDMNTAKQLQNMLNVVLEQTNKLQSQLPRSVWDRIASPGNINPGQRENKQDDPLLKGRYVQEMGSQDILITMPNKRFLDNDEPEPKSMYKKYNNLSPLEPNTIMPVAYAINSREEKSFRITPERFARSFRVEVSQNRDLRSCRNEMENMKKPISPVRRQISSPKHRVTPPKRLSPKRPLLSPPRRPCSPPRRHFSPLQRPTSPVYRQRSPIRRQISPLRRPVSPRRMSPLRQPSSPRRPSPPRRIEMSMNRPMSPLRHQVSPRQMSPIRSTVSPRRQSSSMKRPISPLRRQIPSPNRMIFSRQEMLLSRRQAIPQERQQTSTMRRMESHKLVFERPTLSRQQSPQKRQMSPSRFTDDWDIPNRRAIEQNIWVRPVEQIPEQNIWRSEQTPASSNNWEQITCNDRRRKSFNQEKWETAKDPMCSDSWNNGGNTWNSKQMYTKPMIKETWSLNSDNKWSPMSMPGSSNDNWNIRGKDSLSACTESWMDNKNQGRWESLNVKDSWKCDKEDLNDLPEDAKDPWGDDGISDLKERWHKFESTGTSNAWVRENEQQRGDSWNSKYNKDNWQNKGLSFVTKSQWQNNDSKNIGESRWLPHSDERKPTCSGWQNGNSVGSWQFQNPNFQSQRSFPSTQFKSSY